MSACPTPEQLARFLANTLSEEQEKKLAAHVESCEKCIEVLEQLTSGQLLAHEDENSDAQPTRQPEGTVHSTPGGRPSTRVVRAEQPSGLSGEELFRLRGMLPDRSHARLVPLKTGESGFPELPGYHIEAELGRGGMGVVYRARQTQLNRPVALKMILNSQFATQEQVVRFLAEAQTCAAVQHPGIVQIFEVGQHAGVPFFSMELLEVGTLAEYVAHHDLSPRDAAALIEDVARAIHAAHLHGVVHRDLKPANILLQNVAPGTSRASGRTASGRTASGRTAAGRTNGNSSILRTQASPLAPKITDFGLARRHDFDAGLTQTGVLLGTPDYMAPEQVEPGKHHVGPAVDVYSLGALLYFLLTGRPPFASATVMETLEAVKSRDAASPSRINQAIPHDLSIICLHCLEKQPDHRYATAELLADDLHRFLNGLPISAQPVSEFERMRKWTRRNPGVAALVGSLAATIIVALVLVTWQWTEAANARDRETQRANSETIAKQAEASARREAQLLSLSYALDHGIQRCQAGQFREGLLSMVRALELLPDDEPNLEFAIRANIDSWHRQVCQAEFHNSRGTPYISVAFSPDGKTALVGDWGNAHGEFDPAQIQMLAVDRWNDPPIWRVKHPGAVWSVAFSPDGQRVALGGFNGTSLVLDAATGQPLSPPLPHSGRVYSVAFSPDGKILATAGHVSAPSGIGNRDQTLGIGISGELCLWDVAEGTMIGQPHAFRFRVNCLAWHPSGQSIALGGLNIAEDGKGAAGIAVMFEVKTSQLIGSHMVHPDAVGAIAFAPDTGKLATGCRDGLIRFWDISTGAVEPAPLYQTRTINSLAFSRDGRWLAAASGHHEPGMRVGTGEVHVWNVSTRTKAIEPPFERIGQNSQKMHSIAFGDTDRKLAAVSEHGRAWLWTLPPGVQPMREWTFSQRSDLYHSPDGKKLLLNVLPPQERGFGMQPCEFHLIDNLDGHTIAILPHPTVSWARFSPDSRMLATFGNRSDTIATNVGLWNADTGERVPLPKEFPAFVQTIHFTADGTTIQTVSDDGQFQAWDSSTRSPRGPATRCCEPGEIVRSINPLGTRALISGSTGTRLVSLPACQMIAALKAEASLAGGFTDDGTTVFATGADLESPASRWNAIDGSAVTKPVDSQFRYAKTWLEQGHWRIVDLALESSRPVTDDFSPHLHLNEASLHPSERFYVTTEGNASDEIHFWSITGKTIGPPIPHGRIHRVLFHPDGQSLITSSHDGSVRQWPVPQAAEGSVEQWKAKISQLLE